MMSDIKRHWDDIPSAEELHKRATDDLCCMTPLEKFNHLYACNWSRPTDSTFVELRRPR